MYSFAEEIKKIRNNKRMTLEEMAESLNSFAEKLNETNPNEYPDAINKGLISRWENGKTEPRMDTVRLISKWSNVPVDRILGLEEEPNNVLTLAAHAENVQSDLSEEDIEKIMEYMDFIVEKNRKKGKL